MSAGVLESQLVYQQALEERRLRDERIRQRWQLARQTTWLVLLTVSYLIFYLLDIMEQSIAISMMRY